jgi:nucleotidyltransferase/DNA polymerase involved in DNA repair
LPVACSAGVATCSVGIAPNKLVAKIASDFKKPDGLTMVRPEDVQAFLDRLRTRVILGIGPKTEAFLHGKGIRTVADDSDRVERARQPTSMASEFHL